MKNDPTLRLKILAVDDDPETREVFQIVVGPLGHELVTLADSREAAQRLLKEKFDLIALNALMPHLDGFELAKRVRSSPSNQGIPILMITPADSEEAMRRGFDVGVTFYMPKPIDPEKLRGLFTAARGAMIAERRRYVRLPIRIDVECEGPGRRFQTRSLDLAQGGILLESSEAIILGDTPWVSFHLPGVHETLKLKGEVVRKVSPNSIALRFVDAKQFERAALHLFFTNQTMK